MEPLEILNNKSLKATEQAALLMVALEKKSLTVQQLLSGIDRLKAPMQAKILGVLEGATRAQPNLVNTEAMAVVTDCLHSSAPSVIRESARIIANTIHLHTNCIPDLLPLLIKIAGHEGTVVRWSAATGLNAIAGCAAEAKPLELMLTRLAAREKQASIVKIYQKALKTLKKRWL
jgi:hypothetical protein